MLKNREILLRSLLKILLFLSKQPLCSCPAETLCELAIFLFLRIIVVTFGLLLDNLQIVHKGIFCLV